MKKVSTLCFFLFMLAATVFSQKNERRTGEILVHLAKDYPISNFLKNIETAKGQPFSLLESPAPDWNIHLIKFDEKNGSTDQWLYFFRGQTGVVEAQLNFKTDSRDTEPNDADFWRQWDMKLIGAPKAWDNATGGVTAQGDTIVIAVLEKGADFTHPDLAPNQYFNWKETVGNAKDDDGNGYTDDFAGWNPRTKDDDPGQTSSHGTGVHGIIGAVGNNSAGVAGINWHVKLMHLGNVEYESEIIAAYNYVAKMRKLYNQTAGNQGAFVVATNASFGIDNEFADQHEVWCAVYDSLGKVGVLSVGATANQNVDVDKVGDMPTTCSSEYLITVTNLDKTDKKVNGSGYGKKYVDLAAPGQDTYTTTLNGGFSTLGGTSAATPHVTGSIGLLYSLGCETIAADSKSNPTACARRFRDLIFSSISKNSTLTETVTGGRLDLGGAMENAVEYCGGSSGPMEIFKVTPSFGRVDKVSVSFETPDYATYTFRIFNTLGQLMWEEKVVPEPFGQKIWYFNPFNWAAGMYFITLNRGRKQVVEKFLKL